jgi:hypothetical protein
VEAGKQIFIYVALWAIAVFLLGMVLGCSSVEQRPDASYPAPARPTLPSISKEELQCLSPQTWQKLEQRDRMRRQYAERLEATR